MTPKVHPIWRGVGFVMMIMSPLMAYGMMELFIAENAVRNLIVFPKSWIVQWQDPLILIKIIGTIFLSLVIMMVLQLVVFILMRLLAPPRYGPLDVPPTAFKGKSHKR
jgi:hypothetical protein